MSSKWRSCPGGSQALKFQSLFFPPSAAAELASVRSVGGLGSVSRFLGGGVVWCVVGTCGTGVAASNGGATDPVVEKSVLVDMFVNGDL